MINFANNNLLWKCFENYLTHLASQGKKRASMHNFRNPTRQLIKFLMEKGITEPEVLCVRDIEEFQIFLYTERDFSYRSVVVYIKDIRLFINYLSDECSLNMDLVDGICVLPKFEIGIKQQSRFYTFDEILVRYLAYQKKWVSYGHLNNIQKHLKGFIKYLKVNEVKSVYAISASMLIKYRDYLWEEFVNYSDSSLVVRSQKERLQCVVRLFRYLCREGILKENPAVNLGWEQYYKDIIEKAKQLPEKQKEENDLTEFERFKTEFLDYQRARGKSKSTIAIYRKGIEVFFDFMDKNGIANIAQVDKKHILKYFTNLCNYVGVRGLPASNAYKNHILWAMKIFFRFLVRFDYLAKDPSLDLESIKEERGLPRTCLNKKEVFELLDKPELNNDPLSCRDKAIMELLFSTGMRSNELCSLNIEDIDYHQEMVRINNPKGGKSYQRVVCL